MTKFKKMMETIALKYNIVLVCDQRDTPAVYEVLASMDERWDCKTFAIGDAGLMMVEFSMSEGALLRTLRALERSGFIWKELSSVGCLIRLYHVEESH